MENLAILEMNLLQRAGGNALFAQGAADVWKEALCGDGPAARHCGLWINRNTA